MVGSYWNSPFSGAFAVSFREGSPRFFFMFFGLKMIELVKGLLAWSVATVQGHWNTLRSGVASVVMLGAWKFPFDPPWNEETRVFTWELLAKGRQISFQFFGAMEGLVSVAFAVSFREGSNFIPAVFFQFRTSTPEKFDELIPKNGHMWKGVAFSKPSFWVSILVLRECTRINLEGSIWQKLVRGTACFFN